MPRRLEEITATPTYERYRFDNPTGDVVILQASATLNGDDKPELITLVGAVEDDGDGHCEPAVHLTYRFYGGWSDHPKYGRQFKFNTFVRALPHSRAGVVKYLSRAPGIGKAYAAKLFDKFGSDAVKVLRDKPEVAAAAHSRLSVAAAQTAAEWLEKEKAIEDCMIELIDLLEGRGFPKRVAKEAVKEWGNQAAAIIKGNPYKLMRFRGCGFKRADAMYLELGHRQEALKRQALCSWYTAASDTSGDTWHYYETINQGLKGSVAGAEVNYPRAMKLATRGKLLERCWTEEKDSAPSWDGEYEWVAEASKARAERYLARYVVEAMGE